MITPSEKQIEGKIEHWLCFECCSFCGYQEKERKRERERERKRERKEKLPFLVSEQVQLYTVSGRTGVTLHAVGTACFGITPALSAECPH